MKRENEKKNKKQGQRQEKTLNLANPDYYVCRELSWLQFNLRVLNEARDKTIPLFERLKFLSIVSSNLDEFFMVRVASLKDQVLADFTKRDIAGLTAAEQLKKISEETHEMVELQYHSLKRSLLPALGANYAGMRYACSGTEKPLIAGRDSAVRPPMPGRCSISVGTAAAGKSRPLAMRSFGNASRRNFRSWTLRRGKFFKTLSRERILRRFR